MLHRVFLALALTLCGVAQAQQPTRPAPVAEIAPGDGEAGIAAIVDRRTAAGCAIALGLQHRTGRTRDMALAQIEVFAAPQISEVIPVMWRFTDEGATRWAEIITTRPCQPRPAVIVRSLRLCAATERAPLCEPTLVAIRPGSRRPLPWLEVGYRVAR